jgi:L-fuconolactonase
MNRRQFLAASATATATFAGCTSSPSVDTAGIIDTHTHFYDPTRPQGVPWPPKNDALLHRPVLPDEFARLTRPLGVAGTVIVEASTLEEDNQWVLDLAAKGRPILGVVGHLKPARPGFAEHLARFARNPLFLGIRAGTWEGALKPDDATTLSNLRLLSERNLSLDVNPGTAGLASIAKIAGALPELRIIINHCANVRIDGKAPPTDWLAGLAACAAHRNVFMKGSGLVEGTGRNQGDAPSDAAFYKPVLDAVWERFGDDRVVFGSNWPVSARFAGYETVLGIVRSYADSRGASAARAYFSGNARRVYGVRG